MTLALAAIGCAPVSSSTPSRPTSSSPHLTPPTTPPHTYVTVRTPLLTYRGHTNRVYGVVWHGTRIASGGADGTVQVWDAATGGNVLTYLGQVKEAYSITDLAWSPMAGASSPALTIRRCRSAGRDKRSSLCYASA